VLDDDRRREDYAFARPSLTDKKRRALELRAALPSRQGRKGTAAAYSLKDVRQRELEVAQQAEHAYRRQVADWQASRRSKEGMVAANGTRLK
jgi:transposase